MSCGCRACNEARGQGRSRSRRWVLTPEGEAALDGYVYVRKIITMAQLQEIAEQNRRAR